MLLDFSKGVRLRVEGEIGKFNTLPVDHLVNLAENLQQLLQNIARHQLEVEGAIDLANFAIELASFEKGGAIPGFVFTPRIKMVTSGDVFEQRRFVNRCFEKYMQIADTGNYEKIRELIPQASARNIIVEDLYSFVNTFGNSPVSFVAVKKGAITPIYKIKKFKAEIKEKLLTKIAASTEAKDEYEVVAKVKVVRKGNKVTKTTKDIFDTRHGEPGYSTDVIICGNTTYVLASPLRSKIEKEDGFYVIESEMLDITGTGKAIDEAEKCFSQEFHGAYKKYRQMPYEKLGDRLKRVKTILTTLVTKIESA